MRHFVLVVIFLCGAANAEPSVKERPFFKFIGKSTTAETPWVFYEAPLKSSSEELLSLRKWLLSHQNQLATWPPKFSSDAEAVATVNSWQERAKVLERTRAKFPQTMDAVVLLSTFYFYGHNIDEPAAGATNVALEIARQAELKFPSSPIPHLLQGLIKAQLNKGHETAETHVGKALKLTKDPKISSLIHLGLAASFLRTCQRHAAMVALAKAVELCPSCHTRSRDLMGTFIAQFGARPPLVPEDLKNFSFQNRKLTSSFWGLSLIYPKGWKTDSIQSADKDLAGFIDITAPPLAPKGLLHSLMTHVRIILGDKPFNENTFFRHLSSKAKKVVPISPLVENRYLERWYYFETDRAVGTDDRIAGYIALTKPIVPSLWSFKDHQLAMTAEPATCEEGKQDENRKRPLGRVVAPIELMFVYNASVATLDVAKENAALLLSSFELENRAESAVARPVRQQYARALPPSPPVTASGRDEKIPRVRKPARQAREPKKDSVFQDKLLDYVRPWE